MGKIPVYSIDSDVPVPVENYSESFPLEKLEVGESILFPIEKRSSVATRASRMKGTTGKEFITKKMDDENARVWRIK